MANLVYHNGVRFRINKGFLVLDVVERAVNTEVIERDYKDNCFHPSAHYDIYIVVSYKDKKYRLSIVSKESRDTNISIEMFTEVGFKTIANTWTLGFVGEEYDNVHHLHLAKTTEEQRGIVRSVIERMIDYIAILA